MFLIGNAYAHKEKHNIFIYLLIHMEMSTTHTKKTNSYEERVESKGGREKIRGEDRRR